MSHEPPRRHPGRRMLEPDRDRRRSQLSRAEDAHPLPELPVHTRAARAFFDRPAPEGYLAEWTRLLAQREASRRRRPRQRPDLPTARRMAGAGRQGPRRGHGPAARPSDPPPHQRDPRGAGQHPRPAPALRLAARPARRRTGRALLRGGERRRGRRTRVAPEDRRHREEDGALGLPGRRGPERPSDSPGRSARTALDVGQGGRSL